jgi:hypothetical protein
MKEDDGGEEDEQGIKGLGERLDFACVLFLQHEEVHDEADNKQESRDCREKQQGRGDLKVYQQQPCGAKEDRVEQGA